MKDLVYIQVILNGRALKPHPALLCISISWRFCAVEQVSPAHVGPKLHDFPRRQSCTEHTDRCTEVAVTTSKVNDKSFSSEMPLIFSFTIRAAAINGS